MPSLPVETLEFEARLIGVDPPIRRRFKVPTHHSLADAHLMLQVLMAWENKHLCEFAFADCRFEAGDDPEATGEDATEVCLSDLNLEPGSSLRYEYDFGDEWTLALIVVDQAHGPVTGPVCTAGERVAPPDDAGGAAHYMRVLAAQREPEQHPDLEEAVEWLPPDFDPERFDRAAVNRSLAQWAGRAI